MSIKTRRTTRNKSFNPSSDFIDDAVAQFLQAGGQITQHQQQDDEFERFMQAGDFRSAAERQLPS